MQKPIKTRRARCFGQTSTSRARSASIALLAFAMLASRASGYATSQPASRPTSQPAAQPSHAGGSVPGANDLTNLSLEDLMNVEVMSVSRQKQKISEAAAAITVISQEDIQRSGLNSLPEALRLSPGLDVARLNANTWAISSRGFNDTYSTKLLVLSDGRSIYSPLFSGVFWDMQQPLMQDMERIEVIRGPGATIWGANAVNGVINITSKSARDTQGLLVTGTGGNYEQTGGVRYGGQIDDKTFFRITAKYQNTYNFPVAGGGDGHDGWQGIGGGFRMDRYATDADTFTLQMDTSNTREAETELLPSFTPPAFTQRQDSSFNALGIDVLGRWTHVLSDKSDFSLQAYYDRLYRPGELSNFNIDVADVEFHHRFPLGERQEVIWGAEYRFWDERYEPGPLVAMNPPRRSDYLASTFIQDDLTVVPDRVHLIAGTKLEENSTSGFEYEPSIRTLWTPNEQNTLWAAVSSAVRTPSVWEQYSHIAVPPGMVTGVPVPIQAEVFGSRDFNSESLMAYEIGYRMKPAKTFSVDASIAYNAYSDLRGFAIGTPAFVASPPHLMVPVHVANELYGESYTAELAANWQVTPAWRLAASYSFMTLRIFEHGGVTANNVLQRQVYENGSPKNQAQIHSYLDITRDLQLNVSMYFVDRLAAFNVPAYVRGDIGITWTPRKNLEISAGVQNVFDNQHPEFSGSSTTFRAATEVPRTYYGQVTWRY